ncbi:MAG: sensor histidine kinase [Lachnospiraceae bacterium]
MFRKNAIDRLDQMLDEAMNGTFRESDYDETKLSKVESKWKQFLGTSVLSKENLEKEKENVKQLVSDISHQTKTPMANIKLYAALLQESLEKEPDAANFERNLKLINEISRQTEKLEFLIQMLTKMSRLESNIVKVEPICQSLHFLIEDVMQDMWPKAQKKQIELLAPEGEMASAYFDRKWTKEALGNVVDNAIKYSPVGGKVQISVTEYEIYTAISVRDWGIGIRPEEQANIFGRFYRAGEVQQEEGVGIGLYLTREILKKEGGYIMVKSKPKEGSEFRVYLLRKDCM